MDEEVNIVKVVIRVGLEFFAEPSDFAKQMLHVHGAEITEEEAMALADAEIDALDINGIMGELAEKIEAKYVKLLEHKLAEKGVTMDFPLYKDKGGMH